MYRETNTTWHSAKHIIAALLLIIGAFVAIDMFTADVSAANESAGVAGGDAAESVSALDILKGIQIDRSFLNDPQFTSLREYTLTIPILESGRVNPFAPLNGGAAASAQTRTGTR